MNLIVPATLEHALSLAGRLRAADRNEVRASSGFTPEESLVLSLALSGATCWTWTVDGVAAAMFGVARLADGVGAPWLLGSDEVVKQSIYFLRQSRRHIRAMLAAYPVLVNHVDCRNTVSIQWLSWCGFALCEVEPFHGVQRLPFIRFQLAA